MFKAVCKQADKEQFDCCNPEKTLFVMMCEDWKHQCKVYNSMKFFSGIMYVLSSVLLIAGLAFLCSPVVLFLLQNTKAEPTLLSFLSGVLLALMGVGVLFINRSTLNYRSNFSSSLWDSLRVLTIFKIADCNTEHKNELFEKIVESELKRLRDQTNAGE